MIKSIAQQVARQIYSLHLPQKEHGIPDVPGATSLKGYAKDGTRIEAWYCLPPGEIQGTVVFGHGYTGYSIESETLDEVQRLGEKFGLAACSLDFRHHGMSQPAIPTFGTAESWDMCAIIDAAEEKGLPEPFIVIGQSLGGMAAQRAAVCDPRIKAAVMLHTPGWPWDAIGKITASSKEFIENTLSKIPILNKSVASLGQSTFIKLGRLIDKAYGWDILSDGDIRAHPQVPPHEPRMLYLMGDQDRYDYRKLFEVYRHLYPDEADKLGEWPEAGSAKHKWFVTVPDATHPDETSNGYHVTDWADFHALIDQFIEIVMTQSFHAEPPTEHTSAQGDDANGVSTYHNGASTSQRSDDMEQTGASTFGTKIRGVNLGGWLVIEKWMTPSLFEGLNAVDETSLCLELGGQANSKIARHRETFITEDDFAWLAAHGINGVRIPVGYWLFGPPYPYHPKFGEDTAPFVDGAVNILDMAFDWAEKHGLNIQIDFHAAPGCQNGFDNGGIEGVIDWPDYREYIDYSLDTLERLAERYCDRQALHAIGVLNEPHWDIPTDLLKTYTEEAYRRIRKHCQPQDVAVVFDEGFRHHSYYKGFLQPPAYQNVVFDIHRYQCFAPDDFNMDIYGHIQKAAIEWKNEADDIETELGLWTYVGEWSLGLNQAFAQQDKLQRDITNRAYGAAQLATFEKYLGWYFWSYKTETMPEWNFRECVERGWLPENFLCADSTQ